MVKLSEFVGEVVSELAQARSIADATSVHLSQTYHADAFLKEMPVPHYTIDEAEISFPLSVVSVLSGADNHIDKSILDAIRLKLPTVLYQTMKQFYVDKEKEKVLQQQQEKAARADALTETAEKNPADDVIIEMEKGMEYLYRQIANRICAHIEEQMRTYLSTVKLELAKPLDMKDVFMDFLQKEYVSEFSSQNPAKQPVETNESLADLIQTVGTAIFFEFIDLEHPTGVLVEACTGHLGEYTPKNACLNIKLKIKEQDLDFVVTGVDEKGSTQRFLSLS